MSLVVGAEMGGIADTRLAILQFTTKPKLLDKHMGRPPFAFLHSVISNIILNTGYQKHLFTPEEHDAKTIKSKAGKIAWLQKIKDAVNTDLRISMTLNLGKVCAGKEVENTRMFLQHFCRATKMHTDLLGVERVQLESAQLKFAMGRQGHDTGGTFGATDDNDARSRNEAAMIRAAAEADAKAADSARAAEEQAAADAAAAAEAAAAAAAKAAEDAAAAAAAAAAEAQALAQAEAEAQAEAQAAADAEAAAAAAAAAQAAAAAAAAEAEAEAKARADAEAKAEAEAEAKKKADALAKAAAEAKANAAAEAQAAAAEEAAKPVAPAAEAAGEAKSPDSPSRRRRKKAAVAEDGGSVKRSPTQQLSDLLVASSPKRGGELDVGLELAKSRAAIGALIQKPELTDKLMGRPPFTFLHAIIRGVLAATGYGADLYSTDELNPKTITSKVAKMAFLEKVAMQAAKDIKKPVPVRYGKICAGKEVANTHVFLQHICEAATAFQNKKEEEASVESGSSNVTGNSEAEEKAGSRRRRRGRGDAESKSGDRHARTHSVAELGAASTLQKVFRRFVALRSFKQLVENMFLTKLEVQEAIDTARTTNSLRDLKDVLAASRATLPPSHALMQEAVALIKELEAREACIKRLRKCMADAERKPENVPKLQEAIRAAEKVLDSDHDLLVQARVLQAVGVEAEAVSQLQTAVVAFKAGGLSVHKLQGAVRAAKKHLDPGHAMLKEAISLAEAKSADAVAQQFAELVDDVTQWAEAEQVDDMFDAMDAAQAFAREHLEPTAPSVAAMETTFGGLLSKLGCKQAHPRKHGVLEPERRYTVVRFKAGPIGAGFAFKQEAWACVLVRFNDTKNGQPGQAEVSQRLALGDWLVKVADHDVRGQSWNYVKQVIKNSPRPVLMTFCKPFDWMTARLRELPHDFVTGEELAAAQRAVDLGDMGRTMGEYKKPADWDEARNAPLVHRWLKGALQLSQTDQRCRKVCKCMLGSDGLFPTDSWHDAADPLFAALQERAADTLRDAAHMVDTALYQKQHLVDVLGLHPENGRAFEIVINSRGLPTREYEALPRQDQPGLFPRLLWTEAEDDYTYMCCLLLSMVALNRNFQHAIKSKVEEYDGVHRAAPVKSPMKIWATLSANAATGAIASPVAASERDLMRCCASFSDPQDLLACYESLVALLGNAVNVDNQFAKGFDAEARAGGFRAVELNFVYTPPGGLTWGQVFRSQQTQEIWKVWARSMEAQLGEDMWELLGEFVDHAKTVLQECVGMASRPVSVIVEVKLTLTGYVEHLKKSTMWRKIAEAECPSKLQGEYVRFARERQPSVKGIMSAKRAAGKLKKAAFGGLNRSASLRRRPSFAAKSVLGGGGGGGGATKLQAF